MRYLTAAALALCLGGCSFLDPPKPLATTTAPAPAAPDIEVSGDLLGRLLLTPADLPAGYAPMPAQASGPGAMTGLGTGVTQCGGAPSGTPAATAQTVLAKGMTGPFVAEVVAAPGDAAARELVADVAAAAAACPNFSGDAGGTKVTVSLSQMTVPRYGDVASGVQLVATPEGLPVSIHGYVVAFAYRGLAVTVLVMSLQEIDKAAAATVVTAAERRARTAK